MVLEVSSFHSKVRLFLYAPIALDDEPLLVGNEPDHYLSFTPRNYSDIWGVSVRPWNVSSFPLTEWQTWAKNITSDLGHGAPSFQVAATVEDPLFPFNAPGASSALDCVSSLAAGANGAGVVKTCSEHTYQYSVSFLAFTWH